MDLGSGLRTALGAEPGDPVRIGEREFEAVVGW
jgi:hypothetical protein